MHYIVILDRVITALNCIIVSVYSLLDRPLFIDLIIRSIDDKK